MANASEGPVLIADNSVVAINLALMEIAERLDAIKGLRGPMRIFTRVTVDDPVDTGEAVNLGTQNTAIDAQALFAETSQAQGIKEVLQAVQDTLAGALLAIEADRRRAEAEIKNALDQVDLSQVFAPARTEDLTLGNDLPLSVETTAVAGIAPRGSHVDHVHPGVNLDDPQTITGEKTVNANILMGAGNTVDGVDISVHKAGNARTQHDAGVGTHTHQSAGAEGATIDHGLSLTGLTDDDHTQYLKEKASGGLGTEIPDHTHVAAQGGLLDWDDVWIDAVHTHQSAGEGSTLDHGLALTGLTDDDHTQYLLINGTRAMTGALNMSGQNLNNVGGNSIEVLSGTAAPSAGAGVAATIGSLYGRDNAGTGELWVKTGAADTAWTQMTIP